MSTKNTCRIETNSLIDSFDQKESNKSFIKQKWRIFVGSSFLNVSKLVIPETNDSIINQFIEGGWVD